MDLLAHPTKLAKMLREYMENPELIAAKMPVDASEEAAKMLMLPADGGAVFLCIKAACWCRIRMLSPTQILNFIGTSLAAVLVEVILDADYSRWGRPEERQPVRDAASYASSVN
ncbi:hypothetical protein P4S72_10845 [Vibrio sp. PP-XX7]